MLNCEDLEFSLKGVSMAPSRISMSRHGNKSCCNSAIQCPICPRPHTRAVRYGQKIYITIFFFFFSISILITILTQTDMLYLTHLVFAHLTCFCTSYLFLHILLVLHILFCTFLYSITHFTLYFFFFTYIYALVWCYFYIILFFALSTERT